MKELDYEPCLFIKKARHLHEFVLEVHFSNDCVKTVDVTEIVKRCKPMQKYLTDTEAFKKFKIKNDTITWEKDIDIAPESIYLAGDWKFVSKGKNFREPKYL